MEDKTKQGIDNILEYLDPPPDFMYLEIGAINKELKINKKSGKQLSKKWTDININKKDIVSRDDLTKLLNKKAIFERVLCKVTDSKSIEFIKVDELGNKIGKWNHDFLIKNKIN